jgi:hypothetical protein
MATVNLGSIKFNWQGAYAGGTAYAVDDVVSYNGSSYVCILASTGNLPTNATYFEQMSSAGTNGTDGTDVGTTITTQGDILYRDGSGLQRLGAGTSGQVLQTGGTGANPSWGTVSSDFVKIQTFDLGGSATTTWNLDNIFSNTYDQYQVQLNVRTGDNNHDLQFRYLDNSGSQMTGSLYRSFNGGAETTSSSSNNSQVMRRWDEDHFRLTGAGATLSNHGTDYSISYSGTLYFYKPYATSGLGTGYKSFYGISHYLMGVDQRFSTNYVSGYYNNNSMQVRGLSFFSTTGNGIGADSVITVYGIKN